MMLYQAAEALTDRRANIFLRGDGAGFGASHQIGWAARDLGR
jgi:hypothetical protein